MLMVTSINNIVHSYLAKNTEAATLAAFRILFGLLMAFTISRFFYYGWIDKFYIKPGFFFSFYGFSWIKPLGDFTYVLFGLSGISTLFIILGYHFKKAMVIFFLSFSYIELMDKTYYLNHYYFVMVISFMMIWLPCSRYFSIDATLNNYKECRQYVPKWTVDVLKVFLTIVYLYAGLAKINQDWLLEALPLKIWLTSHQDMAVIGSLFKYKSTAYLFSWGGMLYDVFIAFLLWYHRTKWIAFVVVVIFHITTALLFPIGVFPWVMIVCSLVFFHAEVHQKILSLFARVFSIPAKNYDNNRVLTLSSFVSTFTKRVLITVLTIQFLFPLRFILYPGNLFWTEQGYRFSWRVMLMEKAGIATFKVVDGKSGKRFYIDNADFLNSYQEKQMATQPDFILEYAHYLRDHFRSQGHENIEIYTDSFVALNGRPSRRFVDPEVDLVTVKQDLLPNDWILPYD